LAIIARPVETLGDQTDRAARGVPSSEPADLACGKAEPLGSPDELQVAVDHSLNALQPV
jgi:hypothetical protein